MRIAGVGAEWRVLSQSARQRGGLVGGQQRDASEGPARPFSLSLPHARCEMQPLEASRNKPRSLRCDMSAFSFSRRRRMSPSGATGGWGGAFG